MPKLAEKKCLKRLIRVGLAWFTIVNPNSIKRPFSSEKAGVNFTH